MVGYRSLRFSFARPYECNSGCKLAAFIAVVFLTASAKAQIIHPQQPMPEFEVATIRPWKINLPTPPPGEKVVQKMVKIAPAGPPPPPSPRVNFIGQMEILIEFAFGLPLSSGSRIIGGPDWVRSESERYQLSAKIDDAQFAEMQKLPAPEQRHRIALMEQSLLGSRLGLKVHFETRDLPVQGLSVLKTAPKLEPSSSDKTRIEVTSNAGQHTLTAVAATMGDLVASPFLRGGGMLVNQTGLTGRYDFTLTWSDELSDVPDSATAAPSLAGALEQQLGLRLRSAKAPVEVIVIDHIDRPTENWAVSTYRFRKGIASAMP